MNQFEKQQVDLIICAMWASVSGTHNDIPWQGSSIAGQLVDFKGDLPPPSNYKVESVSRKAEILRLCGDSEFQQYAVKVFKLLSIDEAEAALVSYHYARTKGVLTAKRAEIAASIEVSVDEYLARLKKARKRVSQVDRILRPELYSSRESSS